MLRILTKGGDNEDASFDWVTCATAAVLQLSPLSIRHLKGACKGPKKAPAKASKSASGKHGTGRSSEGGEDGKVYVVLEDNVAVDLLWLASVLPRHILNTLIAEVVPPAAEAAVACEVRGGDTSGHVGWFAYVAKCLHLLCCLVQLSLEHSSLMSALLQQCHPVAVKGATGPSASDVPKSPALLVDVLLFAHTVALALRYPGEEDSDHQSDAAHASACSSGQGAADATAGADAPADHTGSSAGAGGGIGGEQDSTVGGSRPIDVVGMVLRSMALLLRTEHGIAVADDTDQALRPFRDTLVNHPKVTPAVCEGIFDSMDECFAQMTNDTIPDRRRRELKTYVEAAMEALFFCCTDGGFVADLLVCPYMRHGRALSVLKKVLYVEHVECVSLMLRWLLLFCEFEDPPSVDVLAGYDVYNGLLLSVMDRNNDAMVAWSIKSPLNPIAYDLLKAVEVFADDSNFKQGVIDTSVAAVTTVLKRGPVFNGFDKPDNIHLPFTRAFFKLIAALHCFNADVMPADQEHHFARAVVAEWRVGGGGESDWRGLEECLECLVNLPDVIRKSKHDIEELMQEDLELVQDLLASLRRLKTLPADDKGPGGKKRPSAAGKAAAAGGKGRGAKKKCDKVVEGDEDDDFEPIGKAVSKGKGAVQVQKGGEPAAKKAKTENKPAGAKTGTSRGSGSRLRMSEEDLIRQAIEASMKDA